MSKHVFLIDITRHNGSAQSVVGSAQNYMSRFAPDAQKWFALSGQVSSESPIWKDVTIVDGASVLAALQGEVRSLSVDGDSDSIVHVLSYDGGVLNWAQETSDRDRIVHPYSLNWLLKASTVEGKRKSKHTVDRGSGVMRRADCVLRPRLWV